jgi:hypothetical protein
MEYRLPLNFEASIFSALSSEFGKIQLIPRNRITLLQIKNPSQQKPDLFMAVSGIFCTKQNPLRCCKNNHSRPRRRSPDWNIARATVIVKQALQLNVFLDSPISS